MVHGSHSSSVELYRAHQRGDCDHGFGRFETLLQVVSSLLPSPLALCLTPRILSFQIVRLSWEPGRP